MMLYSDIEAAELTRRWHESVLSATTPYLMSGTAAPLLRDLLDVESVTDYSDSVYTIERVILSVQADCGQVLHVCQKVIGNQTKIHCDANQHARN